MKSTDILTSKSSIISLATVACSTATSLDDTIQIVAMSTVLHVHEHKDPRLALHILKISKAVNKTALVAYFNQNLPLEFKKDGDTYKFDLWDANKCRPIVSTYVEGSEDHKEYLVWHGNLLSVKWSTYKPAKKDVVCDLLKKLDKILKECDAHLVTPVAGDSIDVAMLARVKAAKSGAVIDLEVAANLLGMTLVAMPAVEAVA